MDSGEFKASAHVPDRALRALHGDGGGVRRRRGAGELGLGRRRRRRLSPRRRSRSAWSPTSAASTTARSTSRRTRASSGPSPSWARRSARCTSKSNADYVPNLTSLARQQYDLVIAVGFLMGEATEKVAGSFPDTNFAIIDYPQAAMKSKPQNVTGLLFKEAEAGYLVGYMAGLYAKDKGGDQVDLRGRRPAGPGGRRLHRRLPEGRDRRQPGHQGRLRLLAGLRRPGEVQGAGAQPDRRGLAGRLRGRRRLRPRRARRGQGEGRCRASASTPTRPTSVTTS